MMYDILLDQKSDYIDLLIKKAEKLPYEAKAPYYTLIAIQYENIHDSKQAEEYKKKEQDCSYTKTHLTMGIFFL